MSAGLLLANLGAWSVQVAALALVFFAAGRVAPVEHPRPRLWATQAALWLSLLLPIVQPWRRTEASVGWWLSGPALAGPPPGAPGAAAAVFDWHQLWPVAAAGLLLGATVQLARLVLGILRLRALGRDADAMTPAPWLQALRDEIAPQASFRLSGRIGAPATFGLGRAVVLLPRTFPLLDREQQHGMVLHELLHVQRRDWLVQLGEEAVAALAFFHPAVHWLIARVRLAREQCVDADVVRRLGRRDGYLESLIAVARATAGLRAVPAAPFLRESHLRERVDLLLKEKIMSRSRTLLNVTLTAVAVLVAVAWAASAVPLHAMAQPGVGAPASAPSAVKPGSEPKIVHRVNPDYPPSAKEEGVEGLFRIEVVVGTDGAVEAAQIIASAPTKQALGEAEKSRPAAKSGDARLAEAALAAVRQWRWEPVLRDGKPVAAKMTVTVNFALHDKKQPH